jgi:hypothetical protein
MVESICDECGGPNILGWYVDSDVWNRVMGRGTEKDETGRILCPICFTDRAHSLGVSTTAWHLCIDGDDPEINKLRVRIHNQREELIYLYELLETLGHQPGYWPHK